MSVTYLGDTSALVRSRSASVEARLAPLIEAGALATCSMAALELLFTSRSGSEHRTGRARLELSLSWVPLDQSTFDRAVEVQGLLADRGQHRGVGVADLVIAAAAEGAEHTVLHYDRDFDRIAAVTGQPVEWVVPAGSVD